MIRLRWAPFPEADVAQYNVYRSIVGFCVDVPADLTGIAGLTLRTEFNEEADTTITFNDTDPLIDQINAVIVGGHAFLSDSGDQIIVRSDIREAPGRVEIFGDSTSLAFLGITARVITEKSEDKKIATVAALPDPCALVEFEDPDGALQDFYAITSIDSQNNESKKTQYLQPITNTGPVCVLEGIVYDLQGARIPDAEVKATVQVPPDHAGNLSAGNISKEPVIVCTGPDGRFSLVVLQCALIHLEIPEVKFSHMITVPEQSFAFVNDIVEDLDYRYPLGYSGVR
jgi:hypothetical protein